MATTVTVLLEVIERAKRAGLLPLEERQVELQYEGESAFSIEDRTKRKYLGEIERRAKYEPRLHETLSGRNWCIDCTVVN